VDAVGSVLFGQPSQRGVMRGLGSSIYPRNIAYDAFDEIHWVNAAESVSVNRQLATRVGLSGGWSVGCVGLVASWLARSRPASACVVAVFCDGPQRYWNSVYDDAFCREHGLLDAQPAAEPDEIATLDERTVTRWTRCRTVTDPRQRRPSTRSDSSDGTGRAGAADGG
jgi:cysteine synthase A